MNAKADLSVLTVKPTPLGTGDPEQWDVWRGWRHELRTLFDVEKWKEKRGR